MEKKHNNYVFFVKVLNNNSEKGITLIIKLFFYYSLELYRFELKHVAFVYDIFHIIH